MIDPIYILEKIENEEVYRCIHPHCHYSLKYFRTFQGIKYHWNYSHKQSESFHCNICKLSNFQTLDDYLSHFNDHSSNLEDSEDIRLSKRMKFSEFRNERAELRNFKKNEENNVLTSENAIIIGIILLNIFFLKN